MEYDFLKWLGHASFFVKAGKLNVYVDPFRLDNFDEKADVVFITHPHMDHLSEKDLERICSEKTCFVAPYGTQIKFSKKVQFVSPGENGEVLGIKFTAIAAYNTNPSRINFHNKSNGWVGYVIETLGKKIYYPGDTDMIEEMRNVDVDLALIPCGGKYVMDIDEAIEATKLIKAKNFSPIHYKALLGKENSDRLEKKFLEKVKNAIILEEENPIYSF